MGAPIPFTSARRLAPRLVPRLGMIGESPSRWVDEAERVRARGVTSSGFTDLKRAAWTFAVGGWRGAVGIRYAVRALVAGCGMLTRARALFPHHPRLRSSDLLLEWECALAADHPFRNAANALLFFSHGANDVEDTAIEQHAVMVGGAIPVDWLYRTQKTGRPIVYASTDAHALKRFVDDKWNPKSSG